MSHTLLVGLEASTILWRTGYIYHQIRKELPYDPIISWLDKFTKELKLVCQNTSGLA